MGVGFRIWDLKEPALWASSLLLASRIVRAGQLFLSVCPVSPLAPVSPGDKKKRLENNQD